MKKAYIHVGHGKTGSSYLQSAFSNSQIIFDNSNIYYPKHIDEDKAKKNMISSGNGDIIKSKKRLSKSLAEANQKNIFFSNETLMKWMIENDNFEKVIHTLDDYGFEEVSILLFTRNPLEHGASSYQQDLKRQGISSTVDEFFESFDAPLKVFDFLNFCDNFNNVDVSFYNYSTVRKKILSVAENWLNISLGSLNVPERDVVNRSLSIYEAAFFTSLNKHVGKDYKFFSDYLCDNLPNIGSSKAYPSLETQQNVLNSMSGVIKEINRRCVSLESKYEIESLKDFTLNKEQQDIMSSLSCIGDIVGGHLSNGKKYRYFGKFFR